MKGKWIPLCLLTLVSCKGKPDPKPKGTGSVVAPALPSEGMDIAVDPYAGGDNVVVAVSGGSGPLRFGGVRVIPGVHWEWKSSLPHDLSWDRGDGRWTSIQLTDGGILPESPMRLRYRADLGSAARMGFPAVGGEILAEGGSLMVPAFLFVWPSEKDLKITLRVSESGRPLVSSGVAPSCGVGCLQLSGLWKAMETPVSFVRQGEPLVLADEEGNLPWSVSLASELKSVRSDVQTHLEQARERFVLAWGTLAERWGRPVSHDTFQTHVLVEAQGGYQGLEHDEGTLLKIGYNGGKGFSETLSQLAVHESIHVWNGKLVYPADTAAWNLWSFSSDRLNLLYYYEGFTEGYARILNRELNPAMAEFLLARWNSSLLRLKSVAAQASAENISRTQPWLGYEVGAVMALRLAALLREEQGEEEGRRRFWQIHRALTERGAFVLDKSLVESRCFVAVAFTPCLGGASGYGRSALLEAFAEGLSAEGWASFRDAHLGETFLASEEVLRSLVAAVAHATGASLGSDGLSFTGATAGWPL